MSKSGFCIFYAEDDPDDQELFREIIKEIDRTVIIDIQNNGEELLKKLDKVDELPQVIFLDLNMPIKNGIETLREIRESEKLRHLPVVIFTTSDDPRVIENMHQLGATYFITKPFEYKALRSTLIYCLALDWSTFKPGREDFVYKSK